MNNLDQELDKILRDKILLDTDGGQPYIKYTDEAVDALKALITTQKQELLSDIEKELPKKRNTMVGDAYQRTFCGEYNKALDQVKSIITTKRDSL